MQVHFTFSISSNAVFPTGAFELEQLSHIASLLFHLTMVSTPNLHFGNIGENKTGKKMQ